MKKSRKEIIEYVLSRIIFDDEEAPEEREQAYEELSSLSDEELEELAERIDQTIREDVNDSLEKLIELGLVEVVVGDSEEAEGDPFRFKVTEKGKKYVEEMDLKFPNT